MHERTIEWDGVDREWRCPLHDVAHTVVVAATLQQLEDKLDLLENEGRLKDATTEQESW